MRFRLDRWCAACATGAALAGCSSDVNVREQWGTSLSKWGVRPLYPMRENVFLGDVYLYVENPCRNTEVSPVPQTMLVGAFPKQSIQRAAEEFYGGRPALPRNPRPATSTSSDKKESKADNKVAFQMSGSATVTATSGTTGTSTAASSSSGAQDKAQDSPEADPKNPIFGSENQPFTRLRMAAFPDVKLYDYVGGSGGGAYGAIAAAVAGEKSERVTISAQQVEVVELPGTTFLKLVDEYKHTAAWNEIKRNFDRLVYNLYMQLAGASGCQLKPGKPKALIMFVNSVYYTRNLSFEFGENSAFAAKAAATLPTTVVPALPAGQFNPPSLPQASSTGNPAQASSQALLASLTTMSGGPGGGFTLAVGSSGNLALNQTFARPMAFATQNSIFEWPFTDTTAATVANTDPAPPPGLTTPAAAQRQETTTKQVVPPVMQAPGPDSTSSTDRAAPPGTKMPTNKVEPNK